MHIKPLQLKTLHAISILGLSNMILEFPFMSSGLAMETDSDELLSRIAPPLVGSSGGDIDESAPSTSQPSTHEAPLFFEYNLTHLPQAQQLISQTTFLAEAIRLFFQHSAQNYDRTTFLDLKTPEGEKLFFSSLLPEIPEFSESTADKFHIDIHEGMEPELIEALRFLQRQNQMYAQTARVKGRQTQEKYLRQLYTPHIKNIDHEIEMKGPLNYQLFDSFFAHLLGIGRLWWVKTKTGFDIVEKPEKYKEYMYDQKNVISLLQKLHDIGFLNNFTVESLSDLEQFYNPSNQLRRFQANNKQAVTQLVIAGGHIGYDKIHSISKFRNALTIDLSPLELPDIIADINNKELLEELVRSYEGKLDFIIDTSCCGFVFDLEATAPYLLRLLRSGGRLLSRDPTGREQIAPDLALLYMEKYALNPIWSDGIEYAPYIVALEKR